MALKAPAFRALRKSGLAFIDDIPWGTHFCAFYETKEDLLEILIPYFRAGLENNEYCLWVVSEPFSILEAAGCLKKALPSSHLQHMEILPHTEWYLQDNGFHWEQVVRGWIDKVNYALARGYDGIRVSGCTAWIHNNYWKKIMEYEAALEREMGELKAIVLCPYQLSNCGLHQVLDLVSRHQFSFIKSEYDWKNNNSIYRFNRSEIIGKMAAGVVHEIRNPITSVRGFIQLLKGKGELAEYGDYFSLILAELDRANAILTEYLSLARDKRDVTLQWQNLNDILAALLPLMQADAKKEGKEVILEMGEIEDLLVDSRDIRQLVLNLSRNGLEAMEAGGVLELATSMEGNYAVLEVRDTGKGIPEEILNNLGSPFQTTKENGTGLGLFICFKILERYQAKVAVDTSPHGTRFVIRFPASPTPDR